MFVSEILLKTSGEAQYDCNPAKGRLGPLGRINLLVGPNNSGKSRLLRSLEVSIRKDYSMITQIWQRHGTSYASRLIRVLTTSILKNDWRSVGSGL